MWYEMPTISFSSAPGFDVASASSRHSGMLDPAISGMFISWAVS